MHNVLCVQSTSMQWCTCFKSRVCVTLLSVQTQASKFQFKDPDIMGLSQASTEPVCVHHIGGRCRPPRQEECLNHTPLST